MNGTTPVKATRWRDENGNVYHVDESSRNGRYVVIRTNPGGHRKGAKQFSAVGSSSYVQKVLDAQATASGWTEVTQ